MKHVYIINPAAGKHDCTDFVRQEVESTFQKHPEFGPYCLHVTTKPGDATQIARKYAESGEEVCLYACGGDGTMVDVFNGAKGYDNCVLTCLPLGSGNDYIKAYGGKDCAPHFLNQEELVPGVIQKVDHLVTNGIASLNITSVGFDADVCAAMNKYRRLPLVSGKLAYIFAVAERFFHSLKNHYSFTLDGVEIPAGDHIFAVGANGRFYGGAFHPAPYADITDGLLDFITIPAVSHVQFAKLVGSYSKGRHFVDSYKIGQKFTFRRGKELQIFADHPLNVNVDGEVISMENPKISIVPGGVRFKIPTCVWEEYVQNRFNLEHEASEFLVENK